MKRKILIFLYISLERRQNRTTNKTKFKALLHKNKLGKVDNFYIKKFNKRIHKFSGNIIS